MDRPPPPRPPWRSVPRPLGLRPVPLRSLPLLVAVVASLAPMAGPSPVGAHDVWLEPGSFTPPADRATEVRIRVGEGFRGETVARNPRRIRRLVAVAPDGGESPLPGLDGARPAGFFRSERPGWFTLLYESSAAGIELSAETFERHLDAEGLESVIALRRERGESGEPGRELYSRCAKALVEVPARRSAGGPGPSGVAAAEVVGCPLELVLESGRASLLIGAQVAVRLLFDGRPLAGARVEAWSKEPPERTAIGRTSADGLLRLSLDRSGAWLVRTVHMRPATPGSGADWRSWWASLTFEVAPAAPPPAPDRPPGRPSSAFAPPR